MNDKITIQDIIELLAEKHSMDKKDAELFVKGMFDLIEEALASEKYVKVKGLGTFKLTNVDSRESVNVNTGERFEIQGHTKISFTPDTSIRDLINKPFAHFETVILNEGTTLEDTETEIEGEEDQEERTEEVIAEIPETIIKVGNEINETDSSKDRIFAPEEEISVETEEIASIDEAPTKFSEQETTSQQEEITLNEKIEEAIVEENPEIIVIPEITDHSVKEDSTDVVESAIESETITIAEAAILAAKEKKALSEIVNEKTEFDQVEPITPVIERTEEKKKKIDLLNLIIILLVLVIIGLAYWYFRSDNELEVQTPATIIEQPKDTIPSQTPDTTGIKNDSIPEQTIATEVPVQTKQSEQTDIQATTTSTNKETAKATLVDTVEYDITGTKTNYTLQDGESLIKVAIKFYGSKKFWPYIVRHNKDIIKDADRVPIGTTLRIPELTPKK